MIQRLANVFMVVIFVLSLVACGQADQQGGAPSGGERSELSGDIIIDGSSTVFPVTEAVAEEFNAVAPNVRVSVGVSGTGGGFKRFCNGEVTIANASRPIKESEKQACEAAGVEFIELPVAYDGIAVVVHPENEWTDCMTVQELETIWEPNAQGAVNNWNEIRPDWPDQELRLYGPGTDSGTFDYFTEAIVGESGASRGDYTASEDDNVLVQGVSGDVGALGYFGFAYYIENEGRLKALAIDNGGGEGCVEPSVETIRSGTYAPLSRPIFIYVRQDALDKPEVAAFIDSYLEMVPDLAGEVGYVPLPEQAYELVAQRVENRTTGSVFEGGSQPGVTIEELLEREGK